MKFISHRGNLIGKKPELENSPNFIDSAINQDFDVEIDLRANHNGDLYLGHDTLDYAISINYLLDRQKMLWIHCKDRQSLDIALQYNLNCFWHTKDDYTLTNNGTVWAYPGVLPTRSNCVIVLPEIFWNLEEIKNFTTYGICSDIVALIKE